MFRALLCPSSGARDYTGDYNMWHIALCLKLVGWSGVGLCAMRPSWGMLLDSSRATPSTQTHSKVLCATCCNHLYSRELLMMGIIVPETCWAD